MLRRVLGQHRILFASALVVSKPCGDLKLSRLQKAQIKGGGLKWGQSWIFFLFSRDRELSVGTVMVVVSKSHIIRKLSPTTVHMFASAHVVPYSATSIKFFITCAG